MPISQSTLQSVRTFTSELTQSGCQLALLLVEYDGRQKAQVRDIIKMVLLDTRQLDRGVSRLGEVVIEMLIFDRMDNIGKAGKIAGIQKCLSEINRMDAKSLVGDVFWWWSRCVSAVLDDPHFNDAEPMH